MQLEEIEIGYIENIIQISLWNSQKLGTNIPSFYEFNHKWDE